MPVTISQDPQPAYDFLKEHPVGVLSTVDAGGNPHGAVIYFTADDYGDLLFLTKTGTKKADNLRQHKQAMLVVYEAATQTSVQVTGKAIEVTDSNEMQAAFTAILRVSYKTSSTVPPIAKLHEGFYIVYRLHPESIRMAVFNHAEPGQYEDLFTTSKP